MNIQKPNANIFQTKQNPDISHTTTHKNEHTNTQYKHISNKNNTKTHNNEHTQTQHTNISNKNKAEHTTHKNQ